MKIKRKTALLLTVLLAFILISCSSGNDADNGGSGGGADADSNANGPVQESGEASPENPAEEIKDSLPEADYGGYDFRIYMRDTAQTNKDFYIESQTGDQLDDALYKRNKDIEERFNINLKFYFYPYDDWSVSTLSRIIKSEDDGFDMGAIHTATVFTMAADNLLLDWRENMPYIDFGAPWWPDDIIDNLSIFNKLYSGTGDITYLYLDYTACILFNKEMFKERGLDYPYADVSNGKWTLDSFMSTVKQNTLDLNGDGAITPDADRLGLSIYNGWSYPVEVFYCGGDRVISINNDGFPELTMYNERTVQIYEKFMDMVNGDAAHINELNSAIDLFRDERALFSNNSLEIVTEYRILDFEFGILPLPKYDENTPKYYAPLNQNTTSIIAPVTASNTERTSMIIEAFAAEGYRSITPTYYDISLKTKQARDDESLEMLDYIRDGIICDYGQVDVTLVGDGLNNFGAQLVGFQYSEINNPSFTLLYERNKEIVENNIARLKEKYGY